MHIRECAFNFLVVLANAYPNVAYGLLTVGGVLTAFLTVCMFRLSDPQTTRSKIEVLVLVFQTVKTPPTVKSPKATLYIWQGSEVVAGRRYQMRTDRR